MIIPDRFAWLTASGGDGDGDRQAGQAGREANIVIRVLKKMLFLYHNAIKLNKIAGKKICGPSPVPRSFKYYNIPA